MSEVFSNLAAYGVEGSVGAGDPVAIGAITLSVIERNIELTSCTNVWDFGCGIGRTSVAIASKVPSIRLVGTDIVPRMVAFGNLEITPRISNAMFACLRKENSFYDHMKALDGPSPAPEEEFFGNCRGFFHLIYSFSVFTHLDSADWRHYLAAFRQCIAPEGVVLFSAFLLDAAGSAAIKGGNAIKTLKFYPDIPKKGFYYGNPESPLELVGAPIENAISLVHSAGFLVRRIEFGHWRNQSVSHRLKSDWFLQDVIVAVPR